jgi:hypothetical protein
LKVECRKLITPSRVMGNGGSKCRARTKRDEMMKREIGQ